MLSDADEIRTITTGPFEEIKPPGHYVHISDPDVICVSHMV